jgi:phosphopantothenoylcysteine decarboxylase
MARFVADQNRAEGLVHILLVATGSVASIKVPLIVQELLSVSILRV